MKDPTSGIKGPTIGTAGLSPGFDFQRFVERRKTEAFGGEEGARYAYASDVAMLNTFRRIKPVEMAAVSVVRTYKDVFKNQLVGTTMKVTPRQFPSIYKIAEECAEVLDVSVPSVYIANHPQMNAFTYGTDDDAFIVIHSALVDHYEPEELKFVIGHETGHIQNKHVVYGTLMQLLSQSVGAWLKIIMPPIEVALNAWYRRAEITCDRAGLLCCGDVDVAARSFMKLACGSQKLYGELDLDAYLGQAVEVREGVGRLTELLASHPFLPKRVQAMRVFSESEMYRSAMGLGAGGLDMKEVDRRTNEIIQVVKKNVVPDYTGATSEAATATTNGSEDAD